MSLVFVQREERSCAFFFLRVLKYNILYVLSPVAEQTMARSTHIVERRQFQVHPQVESASSTTKKSKMLFNQNGILYRVRQSMPK